MDDNTQQALAAIAGGNAAQNIAQYSQINSLPADGAIPIRTGIYLLSKAGVGAYTLAAPVAGDVGKTLTLIATTNNAHVVTSAAANIGDGTAGLNTTLTFAAFIGASVTLICNAANQWVTDAIVAVTPAP